MHSAYTTLGTNDTKLYHYSECNYAVCRVFFVVTLSVTRLNVVVLRVVAPKYGLNETDI